MLASGNAWSGRLRADPIKCRNICDQLALFGRHGGSAYGAEANAPALGARTQSAAPPAFAEPIAWCEATSLRATAAWAVSAATAIKAADTKVNLVMDLLRQLTGARRNATP